MAIVSCRAGYFWMDWEDITRLGFSWHVLVVQAENWTNVQDNSLVRSDE